MKFAFRLIALLSCVLLVCPAEAEELRERVLRDRALKTGLVPAEQLAPAPQPLLTEAGKLLFESTELSLSRQTSCQSCHLDRFASADGLPVGVGTGGHGEGIERLRGGGDILPRNTLPLWGRGAPGFDTFFWDGKVQNTAAGIVSQFGMQVPSDDPLTVVAHLPIVEIREMIRDDELAEALRTETIDSANAVYAEIEGRVRSDSALANSLTEAFLIEPHEFRIIHVAQAIAAFIRDRFQITPTRLHEFVFSGGTLDETELAGGLVFYGRGRCTACHNGPFFSDMDFHAIPFGQAGFGKNGFGVDYGRFNVTHDAHDLYKFRTPPLFNVSKTSPYSHSGSISDLAEAIRAHIDPLALISSPDMTAIARAEFYKRLGRWAQEPVFGVELDDEDISNLVAFLKTLDVTPIETNQ